MSTAEDRRADAITEMAVERHDALHRDTGDADPECPHCETDAQQVRDDMSNSTDPKVTDAIDALETLEEALTAAARPMAALDDGMWRAYHQADLAGAESGWLGRGHLIDAVREKLASLRLQAEGFSPDDADEMAHSDDWMATPEQLAEADVSRLEVENAGPNPDASRYDSIEGVRPPVADGRGGWVPQPRVTVTDIEPGSPEWDESDRALGFRGRGCATCGRMPSLHNPHALNAAYVGHEYR